MGKHIVSLDCYMFEDKIKHIKNGKARADVKIEVHEKTGKKIDGKMLYRVTLFYSEED